MLEHVGIVAIGNHRGQPDRIQMAGVHTWYNQAVNQANISHLRGAQKMSSEYEYE